MGNTASEFNSRSEDRRTVIRYPRTTTLASHIADLAPAGIASRAIILADAMIYIIAACDLTATGAIYIASVQALTALIQASNAVFEAPNASFETSNAAFQTTNAVCEASNISFQASNASLEATNASFETSNASFQASNAASETSNASFETSNVSFQTGRWHQDAPAQEVRQEDLWMNRQIEHIFL